MTPALAPPQGTGHLSCARLTMPRATSVAPHRNRGCGQSLAISTWSDMALGSGGAAAPATPCPPSPGSADSCQWHLETPGGGPWQGPQPYVGPSLSEHGGDVENPAPAGSAPRTRLTGSSALPAPGQARAGGTPSHRPAAPAGWGRAAAPPPRLCRPPSPGIPTERGAAALHPKLRCGESGCPLPGGTGLPQPCMAQGQEPTATPLRVWGLWGSGCPSSTPFR